MDGDEVDVARELGVPQPHVPGLGRGHRYLREPLDALQVRDELVGREVAAQHRLVPHHDALDVRGVAGGPDRGRDLDVVVVGAPVEPRPERDADAPVACQRRDGAVLHRAVGADPVGDVRDAPEVRRELVLGREPVLSGILVALEAAVRDAAHRALPVGQVERRIEPAPCTEVERRKKRGDGKRGEEGDERAGGTGARQGGGVRDTHGSLLG